MSKNLFFTLWEEREIVPEKIINWRFGPLRIWCKNVSNEIRITHKLFDETSGNQKVEIPDDIDWSRFTVKQSFEKIHLLPVFPDRPVVVQTESPFKLAKMANRAPHVCHVPWSLRAEAQSHFLGNNYTIGHQNRQNHSRNAQAQCEAKSAICLRWRPLLRKTTVSEPVRF